MVEGVHVRRAGHMGRSYVHYGCAGRAAQGRGACLNMCGQEHGPCLRQARPKACLSLLHSIPLASCIASTFLPLQLEDEDEGNSSVSIFALASAAMASASRTPSMIGRKLSEGVRSFAAGKSRKGSMFPGSPSWSAAAGAGGAKALGQPGTQHSSKDDFSNHRPSAAGGPSAGSGWWNKVTAGSRVAPEPHDDSSHGGRAASDALRPSTDGKEGAAAPPVRAAKLRTGGEGGEDPGAAGARGDPALEPSPKGEGLGAIPEGDEVLRDSKGSGGTGQGGSTAHVRTPERSSRHSAGRSSRRVHPEYSPPRVRAHEEAGSEGATPLGSTGHLADADGDGLIGGEPHPLKHVESLRAKAAAIEAKEAARRDSVKLGLEPHKEQEEEEAGRPVHSRDGAAGPGDPLTTDGLPSGQEPGGDWGAEDGGGMVRGMRPSDAGAVDKPRAPRRARIDDGGTSAKQRRASVLASARVNSVATMKQLVSSFKAHDMLHGNSLFVFGPENPIRLWFAQVRVRGWRQSGKGHACWR